MTPLDNNPVGFVFWMTPHYSRLSDSSCSWKVTVLQGTPGNQNFSIHYFEVNSSFSGCPRECNASSTWKATDFVRLALKTPLFKLFMISSELLIVYMILLFFPSVHRFFSNPFRRARNVTLMALLFSLLQPPVQSYWS